MYIHTGTTLRVCICVFDSIFKVKRWRRVFLRKPVSTHWNEVPQRKKKEKTA